VSPSEVSALFTLARLLRLTLQPHSDRRFQFVSCSATISNPRQHMKNIFGIQVCARSSFCNLSITIQHIQEISVVTDDGAPSGKKDFVIWNPPPIDPLNPKSMGRRSTISEATGLMRFLMKRGIRVILFCKVRHYIYRDIFI
jgi:DEAD/DEAH box helicase domain-containing protein